MNTQSKPDALSKREFSCSDLSLYWEKRREEIKKRTSKPQYPTGLDRVDEIIHGIPKGKVTIIGGRTSEAKTSFALQAAFNIAEVGKTICYITLEDDVGQLTERLFCNIMSVDNQELIRGVVSPAKLNDETFNTLLQNLKFVAVQDFGHNFEEIKKIITTVQPKPEIVFLDYVQMIEQRQGESEYESLSRFSQQAKKFAEINDIGLVVISQINRGGVKEGRPQAHHLQGCGRLEQVSDLLVILYCPANYDDQSFDYEEGTMDGKKIAITGFKDCPPDYVELIIAKNKNGLKNVVVPLRFTGKHYRFEEWQVR